MIPGPYDIVISLPADGDELLLKSVRHGYDSVADACKDLDTIAQEYEVDRDELAVIRIWAGTDLEGGRE